MRLLSLCKAPTRETRPDRHNTGNYVRPTLFDECVASLTFAANNVTLKIQETGPTLYSFNKYFIIVRVIWHFHIRLYVPELCVFLATFYQ